MEPSIFSTEVKERAKLEDVSIAAFSMEADVDIDFGEVYFLILHFLSSGPCRKTCVIFQSELLEYQLLPRRYHAWYSRSGLRSTHLDDNGLSLSLSYNELVERYPHITNDHLLKLLKQLLLGCGPSFHGMAGGKRPNAADVPTLLGSGSLSIMESDRVREDKRTASLPLYMRWPHSQADQVRGLSLREIGGGFIKHHRPPSIRAACYAIGKPSTLAQSMDITKKLRGHRAAVYCAIFDRSGRYVITGSDDRLVKIWSMETAFCLSSCRGHEGDITDLAVSSNNALVASSSNDYNIRIWRLPDGLPISVLRGHTAAVTAIAFSPRPCGIYQLLSSSDDGTCRIWDARYSQLTPRIYVPKPPDDLAGKRNGHFASSLQPEHHVVCCAYNANGTLFVTGSSDSNARVWSALKCNLDDSNQPNHEMDVLSGHENVVNYVQFSGCAVPARSSASDLMKDENFPKFKSSWLTHDYIVTCSRDGSAIIWIPGTHKSQGKLGSWIRTYHLKVPLPPLPSRGGPRQRVFPKPRGVNMIVWSLDNRYVLAAITDCRICVWNASDGSLVHSLMGHSDSTYVLDVHPFNPRIAMSAGYDGRTIVWDIWEGAPVRIYETGHFKLVDGKFAPDGTSILLSDDAGQLYILTSGQGESHNAAKYDQFFRGDYIPLIEGPAGNVLDQEAQLASYRRNIQDLLCDSSLTPYPEPYQSIYQQRRLSALGIEWHPFIKNNAVPAESNLVLDDYRVFPLPDLDRWAEPLPDFVEPIDWEYENNAQSEEPDSDYNVSEEYASEGDQENISGSFRSVENNDDDLSIKDGLRRSRRKKGRRKDEFTTYQRHPKRKKLSACNGSGTSSKNYRKKKLRRGKTSGDRRNSHTKSLRPQRAALQNPVNLFSEINEVSLDEPDERSSESDSSNSDSNSKKSNESSKASLNVQQLHLNENKRYQGNDKNWVKSPSKLQVNPGSRRLVVKLSIRDSRKILPANIRKTECSEPNHTLDLSNKISSKVTCLDRNHSGSWGIDCSNFVKKDAIPSQSCNATKIRWKNTSKCFTMEDTEDKCSASHLHLSCDDSKDEFAKSCSYLGDKDGTVASNSESGTNDKLLAYASEKIHHPSDLSDKRKDKELAPKYMPNTAGVDKASMQVQSRSGNFPVKQCEANPEPQLLGKRYVDHIHSSEVFAEPLERVGMVTDNKNEEKGQSQHVIRKIKIKSKTATKEIQSSSSMINSLTSEDQVAFKCDSTNNNIMKMNDNIILGAFKGDDTIYGSGPVNFRWNDSLGKSKKQSFKHLKPYDDQDTLHSDAIVNINITDSRSSSSCKSLMNAAVDIFCKEESSVHTNQLNVDQTIDFPEATVDNVGRLGIKGRKPLVNDKTAFIYNCKMMKSHGFVGTSKNVERLRSGTKLAAGLRSMRHGIENYCCTEPSNMDVRYTHGHGSIRKPSWLLLSEHEESYRYIPQQGDEVAYLIQGHREYLDWILSSEVGPWLSIRDNIRAVEFCKVEGLDYSTLPGSGESCCKLRLKFVDPSSAALGKSFKLTLPELIDFPDFIVERSRYIDSIGRNWAQRDKCQVWWRNAYEEDGSWWEGRIISVKPKSPEFPNSPWERYVIQYKSDGSEPHLHSPWELHDLDGQWEHPHLDNFMREKLLSCFAKIERKKNQDYYGVQKLRQIAHRSDFLNRFAVPLSPDLIRKRLEKNYYRTSEAVDHDISVMLSNAKCYFGKDVEFVLQIQRLSDQLTCTNFHYKSRMV